MKAKKETLAEKSARLKALRLASQAPKTKAAEPDRPVYGIDDELKFGKHRGATIEDVLLFDPGWIRWALENISTFAVTDEVEEELRDLDDPRRPRTLE